MLGGNDRVLEDLLINTIKLKTNMGLTPAAHISLEMLNLEAKMTSHVILVSYS